MLRSAGLSSFGCAAVRRSSAVALAVSAAALAAGCSTDIRRLEQPALGMNETGPRPSEGLRRGVGAPTGSDQTWTDSGPRGPLPPVTRAPSDAPPPAISASPLPPPSQPFTAGLSKPFDRPKTPVAATPVGGSKIASAGTVEVQAGDSLYAIAKRHRVSIAALMEVNQLKSPNLKPGQKLALPATPGARKPSVRAEVKVASAGGSLPAVAPVATPVAPSPAAPAPPSDWTGTYTVKPGDSLYALARAHKVSLAELQRVNGITQPTKVRPGTVLKVPGTAGSAPAASEAPRAVAVAAPAAAAPGVGTTTSPRIINAHPAAVPPVAPPVAPPATLEPAVAPAPPVAEKPLERPSIEKAPAEKAPVVTTAAPSAGAAAANAKFRWPVQGQILSSFGKRTDGTQNDGIDIAVPAGTDVAAASAGTVAYAGSELKGYGNLILLRHDNGWVSAYAHASEILVKRGDTVTRGQVIAKSGQTGTVSQPQLHFELRQGSKPVDPTPHLQK